MIRRLREIRSFSLRNYLRSFFSLYQDLENPEFHNLGYYLGRLKQHFFVTLALKRYLWPNGEIGLKIRVVLSLFCLVLSKVFSLVGPFALKETIDKLGKNETDDIYMYPIYMILVYGASSLLSETMANLRDSIFFLVTQNALKTASLETFEHLHRLSMSYHLKRHTGAVTRGIDRGTRAISTLVSFMLFNILPIIIQLTLVCVVLLIQYVTWISLITFICVVFYIAFTIFVTEWRTKFRRKMNEEENAANNKAIDSLLNYETVKYFGNENHESTRYAKALTDYVKAASKSQWSLAFLNVGQSLVITFGQLAVLLISANQVMKNRMTVGDLVLVNTFLLQLYQPLNFLGSSYRMIKQSLVDIENMVDLLKEEVEIKDPSIPEEIGDDEGKIEFKNVRFSYDKDNVNPDNDILKGITFTVEPQKMVAIVGPSGSGKSTILRLLFRFYDVREGEILIDGKDIRHVRQSDLRKHIGIIPQDSVLFNDSLLYNIKYGRLTATQEEIDEAAQAAQLQPLLERLEKTRQGLETNVGERGLQVSGGERQRISIARCLLKNCQIICEDEATSSLDSGVEKEIQKRMDELFKGRKTTIVIAHRLSAVLNADEILVLKQGEIVERGNHESLLKLNGEYHRLWTQQIHKSPEEPGAVEDESKEPVPTTHDVSSTNETRHYHH